MSTPITTMIATNGAYVSPVINDGGDLRLSSGGSADDATINNGGVLRIFSGAEANDVTVYNGGKSIISAYGSADKVTIAKRGQQFVRGGIVSGTIIRGGKQYVSQGEYADQGNTRYSPGKSYDTVISSGGVEYIYNNGSAERTTISNGGTQYVTEGSVQSSTIAKGGKLTVGINATVTAIDQQSGGNIILTVKGGDTNTEVRGKNVLGQFSYASGIATNFVVYKDGKLIVKTGGTANKITIVDGGVVSAATNGTIKGATLKRGGLLRVENGGKAKDVVIKDVNSYETVSAGGTDTRAKVNGKLYVFGNSISATINKGGRADIYNKGVIKNVTVNNGGVIKGSAGATITTARINSGGSVIISAGASDTGGSIVYGTIHIRGSAQGTNIRNCGSAVVYSSGKDIKAKIYGLQTVNKNAIAQSALVLAGGEQIVYGTAQTTSVNSGGTITLKSPGIARDLILQEYGEARLLGGTLSGTTTMKENAKLTVAGIGVKAGTLTAGTNSTDLNYDLAKITNGKDAMLQLTKAQRLDNASLSVLTTTGQKTGLYQLSKNIQMDSGRSVVVKSGSTVLAKAKVNGSAVAKNGVKYAFSYADTDKTLKLKLTVDKGTYHIGNSMDENITGTVKSDIFYGGGGNDNINGRNGRDVAVYTKDAWGKDTIATTSGTMTLIMVGVSQDEILQKKTDTTMTLTRLGANGKATGDSISIKGWTADTHNIVYRNEAAVVSAVNAALKSWASLSDTRKEQAKDAVFKNAGLATS